MTVLIAPDKFKGTMTAAEVAAAVARGSGPDVDLCPLADGGDGTAAVLIDALGGRWVDAAAHDALGAPIDARFALLGDGREAVVEVAEASGLARLGARPLDPIAASSEGTGELIAAAIEAGAERVLLACGGSATTDAGLGALRRFDLGSTELVCLCDVKDSFMGALRYAPQKGADRRQLALLEQRLERVRRELPHDPSRLPFTGAAGGLAGGLWAHGARLVSGAAHVLGAVGFDARLRDAELVISGEGRLDESSAAGKTVGEVAARCRRAGVACHLIVGEDARRDGVPGGFASVHLAGDPATIAAAAAAIVAS